MQWPITIQQSRSLAFISRHFRSYFHFSPDARLKYGGQEASKKKMRTSVRTNFVFLFQSVRDSIFPVRDKEPDHIG
ncbi:Uncharacterized protein APZ42_019134 [Daphnia magna]|uniref:Uncharacterized protein n=1 Tax=Daphnia magna TaxID=35525 RepID=A0A162CP96_9CRUS|nr:Uncharacterized protein APZ42_019134 [Daphnia magna]